MLKSEDDIIFLIKEDTWMMDILKDVKRLELPDWWVCAGFVRSKIWDVLHHFSERTPLPDIDVIYYDAANMSEVIEKELEQKLKVYNPTLPWSVKNQARMHHQNKVPPYSSSVDAISKFPETATALGVKIGEGKKLILTAPYGIHDVLNLKIKPTPYFMEPQKRMQIYEERVRRKDWKAVWDQVYQV